MPEPLTVQIRKVKPGEALLLLAQAIDELRAAPPTAEDPWVIPGAIEVPPGALKETWASDSTTTQQPKPAHPSTSDDYRVDPREAQQRKIEKLRARIAEELDPDNLRALEATLRLAMEEHVRLPSPDVVASVGEEVIGEGWASLAQPATPEQIAERMQWAAEVHLEEYMRTAEALKMARDAGGSDVDELYAWFGRVGPRGLFTADHIACLQLPLEARRWLVEKMAEEDLVLGKDMGADLLKSEESMDRETAKEMYEPTWQG